MDLALYSHLQRKNEIFSSKISFEGLRRVFTGLKLNVDAWKGFSIDCSEFI